MNAEHLALSKFKIHTIHSGRPLIWRTAITICGNEQHHGTMLRSNAEERCSSRRFAVSSTELQEAAWHSELLGLVAVRISIFQSFRKFRLWISKLPKLPFESVECNSFSRWFHRVLEVTWDQIGWINRVETAKHLAIIFEFSKKWIFFLQFHRMQSIIAMAQRSTPLAENRSLTREKPRKRCNQ